MKPAAIPQDAAGAAAQDADATSGQNTSSPGCSTETRLLYAQLRAQDFLPTKNREEKNDNNATPFTSLH
jgi:hypothetical protein